MVILIPYIVAALALMSLIRSHSLCRCSSNVHHSAELPIAVGDVSIAVPLLRTGTTVRRSICRGELRWSSPDKKGFTTTMPNTVRSRPTIAHAFPSLEVQEEGPTCGERRRDSIPRDLNASRASTGTRTRTARAGGTIGAIPPVTAAN